MTTPCRAAYRRNRRDALLLGRYSYVVPPNIDNKELLTWMNRMDRMGTSPGKRWSILYILFIHVKRGLWVYWGLTFSAPIDPEPLSRTTMRIFSRSELMGSLSSSRRPSVIMVSRSLSVSSRAMVIDEAIALFPA